MRHNWLSSPLLLVPGIRYCTRKYNVPTAAIGTSKRNAFSGQTSKTGRCGERLQCINPTGNGGKQRHLNIIYPYIEITQWVGKINLHAAMGPEPMTCPTTTNRIAMPRKVSTDKFFPHLPYCKYSEFICNRSHYFLLYSCIDALLKL